MSKWLENFHSVLDKRLIPRCLPQSNKKGRFLCVLCSGVKGRNKRNNISFFNFYGHSLASSEDLKILKKGLEDV